MLIITQMKFKGAY